MDEWRELGDLWENQLNCRLKIIPDGQVPEGQPRFPQIHQPPTASDPGEKWNLIQHMFHNYPHMSSESLLRIRTMDRDNGDSWRCTHLKVLLKDS